MRKILTTVAGWLLAATIAAAPAVADDAAPIKGRIIGLKCAQAGKIGECYLKWAQPMVFINEDGDYYTIEFDPKGGIRPEKLDEAFGQEVVIRGTFSGAERVRLVEINVLRPVAGKEFFKG